MDMSIEKTNGGNIKLELVDASRNRFVQIITPREAETISAMLSLAVKADVFEFTVTTGK